MVVVVGICIVFRCSFPRLLCLLEMVLASIVCFLIDDWMIVLMNMQFGDLFAFLH